MILSWNTSRTAAKASTRDFALSYESKSLALAIGLSINARVIKPRIFKGLRTAKLLSGFLGSFFLVPQGAKNVPDHRANGRPRGSCATIAILLSHGMVFQAAERS